VSCCHVMSANRYWSPIASKSRMRPARDEDSLGMRIASKSRMRPARDEDSQQIKDEDVGDEGDVGCHPWLVNASSSLLGALILIVGR